MGEGAEWRLGDLDKKVERQKVDMEEGVEHHDGNRYMDEQRPGDFGETTEGYRVDVEKAEHHDGDGMVVVGEGSEHGVVVKGPEHGDVVEGRAHFDEGKGGGQLAVEGGEAVHPAGTVGDMGVEYLIQGGNIHQTSFGFQDLQLILFLLLKLSLTVEKI